MLRRASQGDSAGSLIVTEHVFPVASPEVVGLWMRMANWAAGPSLIYRSPGYLAFAGQNASDASAALLTIGDEHGEIVGLAPIRLGRIELAFTWGFRKLGRLQLRALAILGSEPLVVEGADAAAVFIALTRAGGGYDAIELEYLQRESSLWAFIRDSDELMRTYFIHVVDGFRNCHFVTVPKSLSAYNGSLSRKRRYNFSRQERMLKAKLNGEIELFKVTSRDKFHVLEEAIHAVSGWGKREEAAEMRRLGALCDQGLLFCYVLRSSSHSIALALGCSYLRSLHILRFLHDEGLNSVSPGTTLWQIVLRDVIETGDFDVIYMGYGEPQYRYSATNQVTQMGRVVLFRRTPANFARLLIYSLYARVKQLAKRVGGKGARL